MAMTKTEQEKFDYISNKLEKLRKEFEKQGELLSFNCRMLEVMKGRLNLSDDEFDDLRREIKKEFEE